jgi:hypothetical protein
MFSSQMDTGRRERWELESRLAKETFFRARFEAKQKPISRPCPSLLACLLSSSFQLLLRRQRQQRGEGGAMAAVERTAAATTTRQFSSKKSSLSIYFIDNLSICRAVRNGRFWWGNSFPFPFYKTLYYYNFSNSLTDFQTFRRPWLVIGGSQSNNGSGKKKSHKCNSW